MDDKPFDRRLRRMRRDRAARMRHEAGYLHRLAADELLGRLAFVRKGFTRALILGWPGGADLRARLRSMGIEAVAADAGLLWAGAAGGVQCDEDRLPFADGAFDLVLSLGVLDSVNDLPGALTLIRRSLQPDGLFLGAFAGAGSLPRLRSAMLAADQISARAAPRIHPQIDVRAAGDLLTRAGFKLPVADSAPISVRFSGLLSLVADLRAMGATNILGSRSPSPLGRLALAAAATDFAAAADSDGKTSERFEIAYLTGWTPAPPQASPAPPGSATVP